MWWGGFSEPELSVDVWEDKCLNPHVVGRFFRAKAKFEIVDIDGLNPHVVGRFFRGATRYQIQL